MAAFFIPCSTTTAWLAASNGPVGATLSFVCPNLEEYLRQHFGQEEHDLLCWLSYYERQQGEEPKYQLDGERTFRKRLQ
jgi:hypothetical protein